MRMCCEISDRSSSNWAFTPVQGGASSQAYTAKPAPDWKNSLRPGEAVAGVLVSGDMSVTGLGTVTYNDGQHVLAFGHPFFNLGPVDMPMSKGEVLMVLASAVPAEQIRQRHRYRRRAASGSPQRHHGRARRGSQDDPRHRRRALVRREATPCAARRISASTSSCSRSGRRT